MVSHKRACCVEHGKKEHWTNYVRGICKFKVGGIPMTKAGATNMAPRRDQ